MDNHSDVVYTLKASYLEVYNEKVQCTVEQNFQIVKKKTFEALKVTLCICWSVDYIMFT